MVHKLAVANGDFQVAHQTEFREYHRVYALPAALAIILLGKGIEEVKVKDIFEPPVKIVLRYAFAQLELREQFLLVVLFSLHN